MGEMARLAGRSIAELKEDAVGVTLHFARKEGITLVLKDARTVVAGPEGPVYINTFGNAGMVAAGSGDILAGVLGSLLAQGAKGPLAGALAGCLYGLAGDIAAERVGEAGMKAGDILRGLPEARGKERKA